MTHSNEPRNASAAEDVLVNAQDLNAKKQTHASELHSDSSTKSTKISTHKASHAPATQRPETVSTEVLEQSDDSKKGATADGQKMPNATHHEKQAPHCNDAALLLLREKLADARVIARHAISGIAHVCADKNTLEAIVHGIEVQQELLTEVLGQSDTIAVHEHNAKLAGPTSTGSKVA